MSWNSAGEFFAMGGYGAYVWGAYGVTLACLVVEPLLAAARHRRARAVANSGDDGSSR